VGERAPTAHDITLRAMANEAELQRLLRLEGRRNRANIWRFVIKTAAVAAAVVVVVVVVFHAASGIEVSVPEQALPLISLVGATTVTALVGLVATRLAGRRDAGAPNDGQSAEAVPPPGGAP
jgi:hypothetical protein